MIHLDVIGEYGSDDYLKVKNALETEEIPYTFTEYKQLPRKQREDLMNRHAFSTPIILMNNQISTLDEVINKFKDMRGELLND